MPKVSSMSHKGSIPLGGLLCLLFILTSALHISNAHAVTYDLTGNGLGLPEGNYEPSLTVSPELTLSALTSGNATGYPTGISGIVFLHLADGTGVRWGDTGNSSKRISGWGIGSYESLVLDFPAGVSAQSITMWFNKIQVYDNGDIIPLDLWVTPFSGSAFQISDVVSYLHYTDSDTAYVVFSELPDLTGVGCIVRIIARAAPQHHLYVSQISYQSCVDNDNDGYPADEDCDDSDPDVNPGATEICNGIDDNCDGDIDEGCVTYYQDADGDGYGDAGDSVTATSPPAGYVATSGDCDDTDAAVYPGASESCNGLDDDCDGQVDEGCALNYRDADGDGYGDLSDSTTVPQPGYVPNAGDCNDGNANINPGETEICNGIDDNCDGSIDEGCVTYYRDADGDTYGDPGDSITATSPPSGYVTNAGDCDDTNASINPGATEICNSVDDNCDGNIDEGCSTYYRDVDGDNYGDPADSVVDTTPPSGYVANSDDCDDTDNTIYPGATELCDGKDNDCDGSTDEGADCTLHYWDGDSDGYGNPGGPTSTFPQAGYVASANDCDDTNGAINPGATEICNGVDDNCDTVVDEGCATYYQDSDSDTYGNPAVSTTATSPPSGYVANAGDCNDGNASINPSATEVCDGVDNNCDTNIDEGCVTYYQDSDSDGYGNPAVSQVATSPPSGYVSDNTDCNDGNASINPGATEVCNGVDDDCDTVVDEGCATYYQDSDSDTYGNPAVSTTAMSPPSGYVAASGDCDDNDNTVYPGASELCDAKDNDCDTQIDEGCTLLYWDGDSDGWGNPAGPTTAVPQTGYVANAGDCDDTNGAINPGATEICNGVDDNCDTNIDEGCVTYYQDSDSDGYGNPAVSQVATSPPSGYVSDNTDCNDGNASINPGATEGCNGVDDDCDTVVDEGCATYYQDSDSDGYGNPAVSTTAMSPPSGYVANAGDCNDGNASINPSATEVCDGVDNNCDTNIDEGCVTYYRDADGDTYGDPGDPTTATSQPAGYVGNAGDCDDTDANVNPGAAELCNGIDDDCDGVNDEGCVYYYPDTDSDGYGDSGGSPVTIPTSGYVANDDDCDDTAHDIHPGATEQCNGVDDDCDGATDEGCVTYYEDADGDGYGTPSAPQSVASPAPPPGYVAPAGDCNDNNVNIHPGATEICNNGVDEDCNGSDKTCAFSHGGGAPGGGITVGGVVIPVDKFALLAPWIGLIALMIGMIIWMVMRKQGRGSTGS